MIWSIVSLFVVFAVIRGIWYAIGKFWAWLGKGKRLRSAVEDGRVSESVRVAVAQIEREEALRKLGQAAAEETRAEVKEVAAGHLSPVQANRNRRRRSKLTREQMAEVRAARAAERDAYVAGMHLNWYHVVILFFLGSILGLVIEELWMFATAGLTESRVGLVWGPFSPLYGVGAVLLTLLTFWMQRKGLPLWVVFVVSMVTGGVLEQFAGWAMETLFGAVSWDYIAGGIPGAISKWVAVPFLFFWGLLGLVWSKLIMPELLFRIGKPTTVRQVTFMSLLAAYLAFDIFMTFSCFARQAEREAGEPASSSFEMWIDENFTDEFIANRFQNLVINGADE